MSTSDTIESLATLTIKAAAAYERPDLAAVAERLLIESRSPSARVAIAGDFKRGKSSLVNALLDTDLAVTDEVVSSPIPTVFRSGGSQSVQVLRHSVTGGDRYETIERADVAGIHSDPQDAVRIDVLLDRVMLGLGLEVVDCPAAAGEGHPGRASTIATARQSDAIFFVTDSSQPLTQFELDLLSDIAKVCPIVTVVMTRIDIAPQWRRIRDLNIETLRIQNLDVDVVAASSVIRQEALRLGDRAANVESGFTRLVEIIQGEIAAASDEMMRKRSARVLGSIAEELLSDFRIQTEALSSPAAAEEQLVQVTAARKRAEGLRVASARWQRMLVEGVQDLQTEIEQRLTAMGRDTVDEGTELLDTLDPAKDWETFEPWLRQRLLEGIEETFAHVEAELESLTESIAFEVDASDDLPAPSSHTDDRSESIDDLDVKTDIEKDRMAALGGGLTALRGSYSGLLMFGMLGSLFGFALLNPVTVALGLTVGGKALWDERTRMVKSRRSKAVLGMRSFVDQSIASLRNELRVVLRGRQREIREHFVTHAEALVSTADAALARARTDAQATSVERARKKADIEAEVGRTRELARVIAAQLGGGEA